MEIGLDTYIQHLEENEIEVVFIDVDHTLIKGNSGRIFSMHLFKKGLLPLSDILKIPRQSLLYLLGCLDYQSIIEQALKAWQGKSVQELHEEGRACYKKSIRPLVFKEARDCLSILKDKSITPVLISASPRQILEHLANDLDVELLSTPLRIQNDTFTGELDGPFCYGEGKVVHLENWLKTNKKNEKHAALSDSISDAPLLNKSHYPCVINPDFRLKSLASRSQWPRMRWKSLKV